MKNYLKNLEKELKKLKISDIEIEEIMKDHQEMLEEAKSDGVTDEDLNLKFGSPDVIANQIYKDNFEAKFSKEVKSDIDNNEFEEYDLFEAFPVSEGLDKFSIALVSEDLIYIPYDGNSLQVFARNLKNPEDYTITLEDGVFTLKTQKKGLFGFSFGHKETPDFVIKVPKTLVINKFTVETVSSDMEMDSIKANNVIYKTTSGDLNATNISAQEIIKLTSVSGDFEVKGLKSEALEISLVSGDIDLENAKIIKNIIINTVSGDAEFKDVTCEHLSLRTVSGDFEGEEVYPDSLELKSVSGDIEISNSQQDKEIVVTSKKSVSGEISINQ